MKDEKTDTGKKQILKDCKYVECYLNCCKDVNYSVKRQYVLILSANEKIMALVIGLYVFLFL